MDDLDLLLAEHAPELSPRTPELAAGLDDLCRQVVGGAPAARPRRRRPRILAVGAAAVVAVGVAGVAAADLPWRFPWEPGTDVKTFHTTDGAVCEMAFTVSNGLPAEGDRAEARRVARRILADFQPDPRQLPRTSYDDPQREVQAFLTLASRTVNDALARQGLPEVNVAAESSCAEEGR